MGKYMEQTFGIVSVELPFANVIVSTKVQNNKINRNCTKIYQYSRTYSNNRKLQRIVTYSNFDRVQNTQPLNKHMPTKNRKNNLTEQTEPMDQ